MLLLHISISVPNDKQTIILNKSDAGHYKNQLPRNNDTHGVRSQLICVIFDKRSPVPHRTSPVPFVYAHVRLQSEILWLFEICRIFIVFKPICRHVVYNLNI